MVNSSFMVIGTVLYAEAYADRGFVSIEEDRAFPEMKPSEFLIEFPKKYLGELKPLTEKGAVGAHVMIKGYMDVNEDDEGRIELHGMELYCFSTQSAEERK